ncbi:MAG: hypothetical protein ACFFDO_08185 [Candidatus Thorarchaeota archaeon]
MTIQIDDAGTGDLIGDAFIGLLRKETSKIIFRTLPVELFQEENWKNKMPFKIVVDLVKDGMRELKFNRDSEKIEICQGNIFEQVRTFFDETGINYEAVTIEGKLQDAVESKLVNHLRDLGVKSKNLTKKSGARRYFVLFNWLCRDFYNREKYVKTGFKKWNSIWREKAIRRYNKFKQSKSYKKSKYIKNYKNK